MPTAVHAARLRSGRLLNAAGFSVGTMNIPFTYPPEALDGFQISGLDTPSANSPFVYPPSLKRELVDHLGKINHDLRFLGIHVYGPTGALKCWLKWKKSTSSGPQSLFTFWNTIHKT